MRLRQLSSNDVVTNPSDYITKAEHGRILDSRLASKDYESSAELARRAADADRTLSTRLKAQATEQQEAHAAQISKLQRQHDAELTEHAQQTRACSEQVQQAKRAALLAEEHAQKARDIHHHLQVLLPCSLADNLTPLLKASLAILATSGTLCEIIYSGEPRKDWC